MKRQVQHSISRLYIRISTLFIVILFVFAAVTLFISVQAANHYAQEVNQNLNSDLATNVAVMMEPYIREGAINEEGLHDLLHSMMVINPSIEIYLLDVEGQILSYVAPEKVVKLESVDLGPVLEFLDDPAGRIVYGDDPRNPGEQKIFSAAELIQGNRLTGYIYIVLASQEYASAASLVRGSYIMGLSIRAILTILIGAALVGLFALWFIVRKLNRITRGMQKFRDGDLTSRIAVKSNDDLDQIGTVFNSMADTIEQNIEELKGLENLRKELIGNISHDLRTPIASIQGYAETLLLKKGTIEPDEQEKYLGIIYKNCENLQDLVTNLFELSKLQSNQVTLNKEPFSIAELVHDVANKYRLMSQKKGVSINTIVSKDIPVVEADVLLIDRVLQNLIDNAIRFCHDGDTINVEVNSIAGGEVSVTISDTGDGIPQDHLPHIFERYFKKDERGGSSGLGLAIVKRIIDLHETSIDVKSVVGQGTSFRFSVPVANIA
ncbi:MAG: ATP-binding protein [Bacteroidales bacterium]